MYGLFEGAFNTSKVSSVSPTRSALFNLHWKVKPLPTLKVSFTLAVKCTFSVVDSQTIMSPEITTDGFLNTITSAALDISEWQSNPLSIVATRTLYVYLVRCCNDVSG
jgi:hypothetical protein